MFAEIDFAFRAHCAVFCERRKKLSLIIVRGKKSRLMVLCRIFSYAYDTREICISGFGLWMESGFNLNSEASISQHTGAWQNDYILLTSPESGFDLRQQRTLIF